jgi:hypothetical protein
MTILPSFEPYVLTPLDHIAFPIHMACFFTFHIDEPSTAIPVLEAGVNRLVEFLPFLAGNVTRSTRLQGKKNVYEVQPSSAEFLQRHPMLKIKHHGQAVSPKTPGVSFSYDTIFNENWIPMPLDMVLEELAPVLRFQANIMQDGIILCYNFHHRAMDGIAVENVMKDLATCCKDPSLGPESLQTSPYREAQSRRVILDACNGNGTPNELHNPPAPITSLSSPLISRMLNFDVAKIQHLRQECNSLLRQRPNPQSVDLSRNETVSALVWLSLIRSRYEFSSSEGAGLNQKTKPEISTALLISQIRNVLQPNLPDSYNGNAMIFSEARANIETMLSSFNLMAGQSSLSSPLDANNIKILAELALSIHNDFQKITDEFARSIISNTSSNSDWSAPYRIGDMFISNIRSLKMYELDFGSCMGKVQNFDVPDIRIPGLAWLMPARYRDKFAPWEVRLSLEADVMERFQEDMLIKWVKSNQGYKL